MSAIEGFVPRDVVRCFHAYLDFCYIARMNIFTCSTLDQLDKALKRFHTYRVIFQQLGVRGPTHSGLSLPRQHAMVHYRQHIENFGAPNFVFIDNGVQTHCHCQASMVSVQPLQCNQADNADQSADGETDCCPY